MILSNSNNLMNLTALSVIVPLLHCHLLLNSRPPTLFSQINAKIYTSKRHLQNSQFQDDSCQLLDVFSGKIIKYHEPLATTHSVPVSFPILHLFLSGASFCQDRSFLELLTQSICEILWKCLSRAD